MNTNRSFLKIVHIGDKMFARISYKDGNLSITGVVNPKRNGNADACGQYRDGIHTIQVYAPGWSADLAKQFLAIWNEWHMNDSQSGSPAQTAWLKANPVDAVYPESHYYKAQDALRSAGLQPDHGYLHEGKPYFYGSAWLRVEVPESVLDFLQALPDTDVTPAWV